MDPFLMAAQFAIMLMGVKSNIMPDVAARSNHFFPS